MARARVFERGIHPEGKLHVVVVGKGTAEGSSVAAARVKNVIAHLVERGVPRRAISKHIESFDKIASQLGRPENVNVQVHLTSDCALIKFFLSDGEDAGPDVVKFASWMQENLEEHKCEVPSEASAKGTV